MLKFITVALLIAHSAFAQTPAGLQAQTLGMANGRAWAAMIIPFEKVCYLTGIRDILIAIAPPEAKDFQASEFSAGEIAASIDGFYSVPENIRIPIVYAARISVMKFKGASAAEVQSITEVWRKLSATP